MLFSGLVLPVASDTAENFDAFFNFLSVVSLILFFVTLFFGIYFVIKYRKRGDQDHETAYIPENPWLEWGSMFIIAVISAVIFIWGFKDFRHMISPKLNEYEVNIIGKQWSWQVDYTHGTSLMNQLVVPVDTPIKLIMTSQDVLHSFFVPAFRTKQDTVPGMYTSLRFKPNKVGVYDIFCAEYCGASHSMMIGKVHVIEKEQFERWKVGTFKIEQADSSVPGASPSKGEIGDSGGSVISSIEKGKKLFTTKTCNTCHSVDGSRIIGPTFKGLWGSTEQLEGGGTITVDENYFRESLVEPMKKITKGYPAAMPTFKGLLTDEEINHLIAYVKSLK